MTYKMEIEIAEDDEHVVITNVNAHATFTTPAARYTFMFTKTGFVVTAHSLDRMNFADNISITPQAGNSVLVEVKKHAGTLDFYSYLRHLEKQEMEASVNHEPGSVDEAVSEGALRIVRQLLSRYREK